MTSPEAISRLASHALRHDPAHCGLTVGQEGWVSLVNLVGALRGQGPGWENVTDADVRDMVRTSQKQRHEIVGDRIRAMYGHSVASEISHVEPPPPVVLFHGTSPAAWPQIATKGLLPIGRHHVHLSADLSTAVSVGIRKAPVPVVLEIDTMRAANAGSKFWLGDNTIWLSNFIDPGSIRPE